MSESKISFDKAENIAIKVRIFGELEKFAAQVVYCRDYAKEFRRHGHPTSVEFVVQDALNNLLKKYAESACGSILDAQLIAVIIAEHHIRRMEWILVQLENMGVDVTEPRTEIDNMKKDFSSSAALTISPGLMTAPEEGDEEEAINILGIM
jgi:hypothetical protein